MSEVIRISDSDELVPISKYKLATWPFTHFNPVQSRVVDIYDNGNNAAIAAATSSGKTVVGEMFLAHEIRKNGGKGIYVGPLKALAKEKEQDWTNPDHHFGDLKVAIVTGDYRLTKKRVEEVDAADLILMTPEMLACRLRNHKSEKSNFLEKVKCLVVDESHILTDPSRGDHIEVALMKMTEVNPDVRLVLLSATMPNVDEVCQWVCNLTNRDTHYLESDYRPCELRLHYETFYDGDNNYKEGEIQKIGSACAIVEDYPDDKFLVFVHTKDTGYMMIKHLERYGITTHFHNADLKLKERLALENKFKGKDLRVIVATSTLAEGLNLPARRVVVTGDTMGLNTVPSYRIRQMVGRAGRPMYDKVGDAYVLVPESKARETIARLKKVEPIRSVLLDFVGDPRNPHYKKLAFHVVAEIHHGNIKSDDCFREWFKRTLAYHQEKGIDDGIIDRTLQLLLQYKVIRVDEAGNYVCNPIGIIASMYYYSPFDVADLRRNFSKVFEDHREEDDFALAMAMGNIDSYRFGVVNRFEREQMASFDAKVGRMFGSHAFTQSAVKHGYAYFNLLKGLRNVPAFQNLQGALLVDLDRTMQVVQAVDTMSAKWEKKEWLKTLGMRLRYGVEAELVNLCRIPNVGQVRAKRLKAKKIHKLEDFVHYSADTLAGIMQCSKKLAEEALDAAKLLQLQEAMN